MPADLLQRIDSTRLQPAEIAARARQIHGEALAAGRFVDAPNFTTIHPGILEFLFGRYDETFFKGCLRAALGQAPLHFGLSRRMTSAGGSTTRLANRKQPHRRRFEIKVSSTLLFECFAEDDHRPITCAGIVCRDRLDALQRVLEHELVHLIEMLLWDRSSCSQQRFHGISRRFFGHTDHTHRLITPKEKALVKYGVRPGARVKFRFDGAEYVGVVNRVNRRATVLVADQRGQCYSDGRRYAKFYIPLPLLQVIE